MLETTNTGQVVAYHLSADVFHPQLLLRHKVVQFAVLVSETERNGGSLEGSNGLYYFDTQSTIVI